MALKERINAEMKAALLGGDRFVGETLRNLKAAILNDEVALRLRDTGLSDEQIESVVAREVKKRVESAAIYRSSDRPELAETEDREAEVLRTLLPSQLSDEEVQAIVNQKIEQLKAESVKDLGKVIGAVKAETKNRASGSLIAELAKATLVLIEEQE